MYINIFININTHTLILYVTILLLFTLIYYWYLTCAVVMEV